MNYEHESVGTYWQNEPTENTISSTGSAIFRINCCGCDGDAAIEPYFCYGSQVGMIISKIFSLKVLTVYLGPYCKDIDKKVLSSWVSYALKIAKDSAVTKIKIIPPFYLYKNNERLHKIYDEVFLSFGFKLNSMHTSILDTSKPKEEVFKKLKYETRRSVRRVSETDIIVDKMHRSEHIKQWQKIKCRTNKISTNMINSITKSNDPNYIYYVAHRGNEALAWTGVRWGEKFARLEGITTSPASRKRKINKFSNYALQWYIVEEAYKRNIQGIDYAGIEPDSEDKKMINIMKFKLSWGGDIVDYNTYTKDLIQWKTYMIKSLRTVQSLLTSIRSSVIPSILDKFYKFKADFRKKINKSE